MSKIKSAINPKTIAIAIILLKIATKHSKSPQLPPVAVAAPPKAKRGSATAPIIIIEITFIAEPQELDKS